MGWQQLPKVMRVAVPSGKFLMRAVIFLSEHLLCDRSLGSPHVQLVTGLVPVRGSCLAHKELC